MHWRLRFFWLVGVAATISFGLLGIYLYKFGSFTDPTLAAHKGDWGTFGDYIGGTLGTLFAFLAFIGVLFTVYLQDKQLQHARAQSKLEELQRLMASHSARIDGLLDGPPKYMPDRFRRTLEARDQLMSVFSLLSTAVGLKSGKRPDHIPEAAHAEMVRDATESLKRDANLLVIELQWLTRCLELYSSSGGSRRSCPYIVIATKW